MLAYEGSRREKDFEKLIGKAQHYDLNQLLEDQDRRGIKLAKLRSDYRDLVENYQSKFKSPSNLLRGAIKNTWDRLSRQEEKLRDSEMLQSLESMVRTSKWEKGQLEAQLDDANEHADNRQKALQELEEHKRMLVKDYSDVKRKHHECEIQLRKAGEANERLENEMAANESVSQERIKKCQKFNRKLAAALENGKSLIISNHSKLKALQEKVKYLEHESHACRANWEDFEVVKSNREMKKVIDIMTWQGAKDLEAKREAEARFEMNCGVDSILLALTAPNNSANSNHGHVDDSPMFDRPDEVKSQELTMSDDKPDQLELEIANLMDLTDDCGIMVNPEDEQLVPNSDWMNFTDDCSIIADPEGEPLHEAPRKRTKREMEDDGPNSEACEDIVFIGEWDPRELCGHADDDIAQAFGSTADLNEKEASTSQQSDSKQPPTNKEAPPQYRLTRPKPEQLRRENERLRQKELQRQHRAQKNIASMQAELGLFAPLSSNEDDRHRSMTMQASSTADVPEDTGKSIRTFRNNKAQTRPKYYHLPDPDRLLPALVGFFFIVGWLWYCVNSTKETRIWMQANQVPANVMEALHGGRLSEFQWVQELDYRIGQWLEIDRVALG